MRRLSFVPRSAPALILAALAACAEEATQPRAILDPTTRRVTVLPGEPTLLMGLTPPNGFPAPPRAAATGGDIGTLATTTFSRFARSPAEGGGGSFVEMPVGGTAYFRDVAFSADFVFEADADGEFWDADIALPGGGAATFFRLTYRREFNGEQDCWLAGGQSLCGSTVIFVSYILGIQCQAGGAYTVHVFENGGQVFEGSFTLKPTLPPGTVPPQLQTDYPDEPYNTLCQNADNTSYPCRGEPGETPRTIKQKGCALAAASMLLNYFGVPTDPATLNEYLVGLGAGGYTPGGGVNWQGVLERAAQDGERLRFNFNDQGDSPTARQNLRNRLCRFGPQIVEVTSLTTPGGKHFVVVTGLSDDEGDFTISDPADPLGQRTLADYGPFTSVREFEPRTQTTWDDVLVATLHSPAELVVTDPLGRQAGFDPASGRVFAEIPGASYDSTGLGTVLDDGTIVQQDPLWKELHVRFPTDGEYVVRVTGTATGSYTLNLLGYDRDHRSAGFLTRDIPIAANEVHQYAFTFNAADMSGGTLTISGGFNGGGQRSDVNALLSYARPGETRTSLAAGTSSYSLLVSYGSTIDPATFQAELNGVSVTGLFTPTAGGAETVTLPLGPGRNVLKLSVTGSPGGRTATDRDQLVFLVP